MMNSRTMALFGRQRGVTLLEIIAAIALMSLLLIGLTQITQQSANDQRNTLVAEHLRRISDAARAYTRDNFGTIAAAASPTTPAYVSVATLAAGGYLPPNFAATNSYGQSVCVLVLEPVANRLQAIVVSEGGTAIPDVDLGAIVGSAGGSAGAMRAGTATVTGTLGGWSIPRTTFNNLANSAGLRCTGAAGNVQLNDGRLAYALWLDSATDAFLTQWRTPVPNFASLPATGNTVGDARVILDRGVAFSWTGTIWRPFGIDQNGSVIASGDGQFGNTNLGAAPVTTATGSVAASTVELKRVVTSGGACSPDGSLAIDASDNLMVCRNGQWSGGGSSVTYTFVTVNEGISTAIPAGTRRIDGYAVYSFASNTCAYMRFNLRNAALATLSTMDLGCTTGNDGGSGSGWYTPISIPISSDVTNFWIQRLAGGRPFVFYITAYSS
jgi:prepilin-type N-terminal cleavage/methylation domain-containing protein